MVRASLNSPTTETDDHFAATAARRPARWWRKAGQPLALLIIDLVFLSGAIALAHFLDSSWAGLSGAEPGPLAYYSWLSVAYGLLLLGLLALTGSYDSIRGSHLAKDTIRIVGVASFAAMLLGFMALATGGVQYWPEYGALMWLSATLFLLLARMIAHRTVEFFRHRGVWAKRVVVAGDGESIGHALQKLREKEAGYQIVGLVDLGHGGHNGTYDVPYLGSITDLPRILAAYRPCEVFLTAETLNGAADMEALRSLIPPKTTVNLALHPMLWGVSVQESGTLQGTFPAIRVRTEPLSWQYETVKRLLDLALGTLALLAAAPLMLIIVLAIKLESPGPILFRQVRVGRSGQPFTMYKFRSMRRDAEALQKDLMQRNEAAGPMFKMRGDPRITRVGRVLRRLSLDELPQLFNVLEGTMSLVGPRPPLPNEVEQYQPWHFRRLGAVPGMTGLWQVNRGAEISFDEMVRLDLTYIDHWSLTLDLKILLKTFPVVISARGAY